MRRKHESSNSWRFRIWQTMAAAESSHGSLEGSPNTQNTRLSEIPFHEPTEETVLMSTNSGADTPATQCPGLLSQSVKAAATSLTRTSAQGLTNGKGTCTPSTLAVPVCGEDNGATLPAQTAKVEGVHPPGPTSKALAAGTRVLTKQPSEQRFRDDTAARHASRVAAEEQLSKDAWNWRFTRKWVSERNRAGTDLDDEGRAFKAVLAGESTDITTGGVTQPSAGCPSTTLSDSLMFLVEPPLSVGNSNRTSFAGDRLWAR
jgi:hypothetical protein